MDGLKDDQAPVLQADTVSKSFGSTKALRGVSLQLHRGRCLGLVGRNGAGKSTLVSILSGLSTPDTGTVLFDGAPAPAISDIGAWRTRISTVYQHSMVVPQLTVAENVFLGVPRTRRGAVDWRSMRQRTAQIIRDWGFDISPDVRCEELGVDQLQIVEIARAMATGAKCVLLDEPTAALERPGVAILFDRVRRLVDHGVAVLYISHHLEEVFEICDDVTVLRDGAAVLESTVPAVSKEDIVTAMVGNIETPAALASPPRSRAGASPSAPRLTVTDVRRDTPDGALAGVSLQVGAGECVGVTGLLSAGVATLGEIVAGVEPADAGTVAVDERPVRLGDRSRAQRAGIGYIPADRQVDGFVGHLGIAENQTMTISSRLGGRLGFTRPRSRQRAAQPLADQLSLVRSGLDQPVEELSGGNQQKVTVARTLIHDPSVIVAITPTRGVDVASKELLLGALAESARSAGAALLLASDELDDLEHCDRIIVLVRGEAFEEFAPPYDREQLIAATEGISSSFAFDSVSVAAVPTTSERESS